MVHINFIIPVSADKKYAATTHLVREEGVDDVKSRIICPLQVVQEQLFESETIIKIVSK
jgi:hypothetical protein